VNGSEKLLKVIKNPITDHLPSNSYKITFSFDAQPVKLGTYLAKIPEDQNVVGFVGAMAHGEDNFADGLVDDKIAISEYSLSASVACGKVSSWQNTAVTGRSLTLHTRSAAHAKTFGTSYKAHWTHIIFTALTLYKHKATIYLPVSTAAKTLPSSSG
jgi:hypothetical protein